MLCTGPPVTMPEFNSKQKEVVLLLLSLLLYWTRQSSDHFLVVHELWSVEDVILNTTDYNMLYHQNQKVLRNPMVEEFYYRI